MIAFGPVPSRRLGRSLGINNIPPKTCTYACVYCQVGKTTRMQVERGVFYDPDIIVQDVADKLKKAESEGETVDYLTFVPDGEPTLDINLGATIKKLLPLGIPLAIITNASLLGREDVRAELLDAHCVSMKIDAADSGVWHRINRPQGSLRHRDVIEGISRFARQFKGKLLTETMLLKGINDTVEEIEQIARFIAGLEPDTGYLAIPIRPPAEKRVKSPSEKFVNLAYQIFNEYAVPTEYLIGYEGNAFSSTGDPSEDILRITAVHPMREDAVENLLQKAGVGWEVIRELIDQKKLIEVTHNRKKFYLRKFDEP